MSRKKFPKDLHDPYINLLTKVFKYQEIYYGQYGDPWDGKILRKNYLEGLQTIITGLPEDAQLVVDLRFGLTSGKALSRKQVARMSGMTMSHLKSIEDGVLFELGLEHCRYFYLIPNYAREDDETLQKTFCFLRGSGFSTFAMYLMAQVGICDTEGLQLFVQLCPEYFDIFTDEGCDRLVRMGCEDPRELETLEEYLFDDRTRIEALNFSQRTHEMLVFGNGITTIGVLRLLRYEDIKDLKGANREEVDEVCEKLLRLSYSKLREDMNDLSSEWNDEEFEKELEIIYTNEMMEDFE
ncbi:hypothetical protein IKE87_01755 [Candidatus Saccharibacteria bacterium]|nr:hypothetical protein [Candidatus Saccharibacteria bacterium]